MFNQNILNSLISMADADCKEHVMEAFENYPQKEINHFHERIDSFKKNIYKMSDVIINDPVKIQSTPDLGLSQLYRLYGFLNEGKSLPNISFKGLNRLPIIGAEFHIEDEYPNLFDNLFFLNMSQFQKESNIRLSSSDEGVAEIRMNPSYYPVTIANWNLMKKLVFVDDAYFSLTCTPLPEDKKQLTQLKSLSHIIYAEYNKNIVKKIGGKDTHRYLHTPPFSFLKIFLSVESLSVLANVYYDSNFLWFFGGSLAAGFASFKLWKQYAKFFGKPGELSLGESYLGQTQKVRNGKFDLLGWRKLEKEVSDNDLKKFKEKYQLNLYSGFGETFPKQAYYVSMAYVDPRILDLVEQEVGDLSLSQAVKIPEKDIRHILTRINSRITNNSELLELTEKGYEIMKKFG